MNVKPHLCMGTLQEDVCNTISTKEENEVNINCKDVDRDISKAVCFQIMVVGIKNMLVQASPWLFSINDQLNSLLFLVVGIIYTWVFFKHLNVMLHVKKMTFIVMVLLLLSFLSTTVFFLHNWKEITPILSRTIPFCFLTFFLIARLETLEWLNYYMKRYSVVIMIFSVLSALLIKTIGHITESTWDTYSMPLSYVTLIGVMWQLSFYFRNKKISNLVLSIIGIIIIIIYGSRNPLLAIAAFIAVKVLYKSFSDKSRYRLIYMLFIAIGLVALVNYKEILTIVNQLLISRGISSRTLFLLTQDTISTSGRDVIHESLWQLINERPFTGLGICGDRQAIRESAHGFYISFFVTYGYVFGSLLLVALVYSAIRAYRISNGINREVLLIYLCLVFPRGFTGGEMWTSDVFWWLLGLIIVVMAVENNRKQDNSRLSNDKSIAYN